MEDEVEEIAKQRMEQADRSLHLFRMQHNDIITCYLMLIGDKMNATREYNKCLLKDFSYEPPKGIDYVPQGKKPSLKKPSNEPYQLL